MRPEPRISAIDPVLCSMEITLQPEAASLPDPPPAGPVPDPLLEFDRLAVVTIQGGGIFGLNLLGQLSYLTEVLKIVPVAVAGNSAGSIVAALYWAGYTPWQIRDIFADMASKKALSALVGPFVPSNAPYTLADFRALKNDCEKLGDASLTTGKPSHWLGRPWRCVCAFFRGVRTIFSLWSIRNRVTPHFAKRGCFQGDNFIEEIDRLIREGPLLRGREVPTGQPLEFGDVRRLLADDSMVNPPALFLTATNVTGRKLEVFNSIDERYDRVPIAKAVRASAGFPAFFEPIEFKDHRYAGWYADGGIVSNYPAWIFTNAFRVRLLDSPEYRLLATRPWVHFGLRLDRVPIADPSTPESKFYVSSLARLVLGGEARTDLEDRLEGLVTRSFTIQQPSDKCYPSHESGIPVPDDLLDIDAVSAALVEEMYRLGREESHRHKQLCFTLPDKAKIEPLLAELIERALLVLGQKDNTLLLLRSNVFIPSQDSLHIRYAVNMEPPSASIIIDPVKYPTANFDYNLRLPLDAGLTGACMTTRRPILCNTEKLKKLESQVDGLFGMPTDLHNQVRGDRTWLASVPIFDPFATYPRELSTPARRELPHSSLFSQSLDGWMDGALLGVLNLDACIAYSTMLPVLDPDPSIHWTDRRIQAVLQLMSATAAEIGAHLSRYFARQEDP